MIQTQSQTPGWQYYLNPWWREEHVFTTRLTKAECQRRLTEGTTRLLGRSVGRSPISTADFTLHRVTFYNNCFRPYAYVRLDESTGTGTVVRVTLSASNWVRYFLIFNHGFIAIVSAIAFLSTLASRPSPHDEIPFLTFGILFVWPVALTLFGRAIATGDRRFLTRFLIEELEATEVQTVSGLVVG